MSSRVTHNFESIPTSALRASGFVSLPKRPGVFRIFDSNGNLILLDRTHRLADRLERFYSESPRPGTVDLRKISDRVEYCTTHSAFESLYLLYLERRRWFPREYRQMRTFARYHLIAVDLRLRFPRVTVTRQLSTGVRHLGPFLSRSDADRLRTTVERAFRLRTCEYDIQGDDPYPDCLYFQIQTCSRPCNGDIDRSSYGRDIADAMTVILERNERSLAPLLSRMQSLAEETRFEEAGQLRLQIERARLGLNEIQHDVFDVDRFDFAIVMNAGSRRSRKVAVVLGGRILGIEEHAVDGIEASLAQSLADKIRTEELATPETRYDEFCLAVGFILRRLRSVSFFPILTPERTAAAVAMHVCQQARKNGNSVRGQRVDEPERN